MAAIFLQGFPICQLSQNCRHIPVKLLKFRQLPPLGFIFSVNLSLHQKVMINLFLWIKILIDLYELYFYTLRFIQF